MNPPRPPARLGRMSRKYFEYPREFTDEDEQRVDDLYAAILREAARLADAALLIRKLCKVVAKLDDESNATRIAALDWLQRNGLQSNPLRVRGKLNG